MQPIIRHIITITIKETWTIRWQDDTETVWHEIHTSVWPAANEAGEQGMPPVKGNDQDDGRENAVLDLDTPSQIAEDKCRR